MKPAPYTVETFRADLAAGPYAWPGGYPRFFLAADGEPLCFATAEANTDRIQCEIADECNPDWRVIGCEINWEDPALFCADCNKRIPSAYAEDDAED